MGFGKGAARLFATVALVGASVTAAGSHPHIWAEARLELNIAEGKLAALQHVWRFDDIFSSTVLLEFDANADNALDAAELAKVGETVRGSIADYDYFQLVQHDGKDVEMTPPEAVIADFKDQRLILIFESKVKEPLALTGTVTAAVYDPTFYTAIDYMKDEDMASDNLPPACAREVVRPDPDEILAQNSQNLTESFYETTDMNNLTGIFATRLKLTCKAEG